MHPEFGLFVENSSLAPFTAEFLVSLFSSTIHVHILMAASLWKCGGFWFVFFLSVRFVWRQNRNEYRMNILI